MKQKNLIMMLALIEKANINEKINLEEYHDYIKTVTFEYQNNYGYIWKADSKRSYWSYYPMKDTNYVKFFKTLKGAKRNFIKNYITKE